MKIIELKAENIKKLKAIEIKPSGNTIIISGKNAHGKSSVLDSIWLAVGGAEAMNETPKVIREGETSAMVQLDLGELTVTRKWTANDKSYLTVENKDGATFKSPQAILDKLIGSLSFDPLAFTHMDDRKQRETLLGMVKIDIDLAKWEVERKAKYEERTLINKRLSELKGQLAGIPDTAPDVPDEEISISSVMDEMESARAQKEQNNLKRLEFLHRETNIDNLEMNRDSLIADIDDQEQRIEAMVADLKNMKSRKANIDDEIIEELKVFNSLSHKVKNLIDPDMSIFTEKAKQIEDINRAVREKQKRRKIELEIPLAEEVSRGYSENLDILESKKSLAIQCAKFPIDGLAFDDTGVTYFDIPFSQCSTAERLRVSLAMAMAMNPKLKVLRIMDGSLLDSQNMAVIQEMVAANDYQCWIERISENAGCGIYIEDGEIK